MLHFHLDNGCDCCGEYHTLLIIDDYPRVIVLIDGVEVLTLNVG